MSSDCNFIFKILFYFFLYNYYFETTLIAEALDKQLRIKISDNICEWRFDKSFIIFKFVKTKSQILVSSLYTKNVCENLVACN